MTDGTKFQTIRGITGNLAVHLQGEPSAEPVVMTHSILSSSAMWNDQAKLLNELGFQVIRVDSVGHGDSSPPTLNSFTMNDLSDDVIAVIDALKLDKVHYVGLSLGGMSGFGLGIHHADRLRSMVLCDARADAPLEVAAPWDERISVAEEDGSCSPLAEPTVERWFGKDLLKTRPDIATAFQSVASSTSLTGFVGCARAIQGLDYLDAVGEINVPTTLIVGENDGVLPEVMQNLQKLISGSTLEVIPAAGHLPNIDQPGDFNAALLSHLKRHK